MGRRKANPRFTLRLKKNSHEETPASDSGISLGHSGARCVTLPYCLLHQDRIDPLPEFESNSLERPDVFEPEVLVQRD